MRFARTALLFLLVVLTVPLGSFAGRRGVLPETGVSAPGVMPAREATAIALLAHTCRGPALPGTPCGPDIALALTQQHPPAYRAGRLRRMGADPLPEGRAPPGILDPPRSV